MDRLPILITLGSAILAYTSASMILHDKIIGNFLLSLTEYMNYILPVLFIGAIIVYSQKVAKNKIYLKALLVNQKINSSFFIFTLNHFVYR